MSCSAAMCFAGQERQLCKSTLCCVFEREHKVRIRMYELIGSLQYLANTTRPDISQAVSLLARYRANPTTAHYKAGLRVVSYLLGTKEMGLVYEGTGQQTLEGYVDSDFAGDMDTRKSTTGFVFILNGGAISWGSKKQQSVATSTVEAEYIAASHAIKEGVWLGS